MKKRIKTKSLRPQFELLSVNFTKLNVRNWDYKSLKARYWRLYWHNEFGAGVILDGKRYELSPSCVYLVPPDTPFDSWCNGNLIQLNVHFEMRPLAGNKQYSLIKLEIVPEVRRLINLLKTGFDSEFDVVKAHLYAISLATLCLTMLPVEALSGRKFGDVKIAEACGWMDNFDPEIISVGKLAKAMGIGKCTLTNRFKTQTGLTPYQFLMRHRYDYAAKLLRTTNYTLGEICEIIGVNDPFNFSRTFKKIYGIPPREYRQK